MPTVIKSVNHKRQIFKLTSRLVVALSVAISLMGINTSALAQDSDVLGLWRTQTNDEGSYLHVDIRRCDSNQFCGVIIEAFRKGDEKIENYENAGKRMIWAMKVQGKGKWSGGKIWAPDTNKTYRSKMTLQADGAELKVSGCIAGGLICRSQKWARANADS